MLAAHGLLNTFGVKLVASARRHQRVVARLRRRDHLPDADDRARQHQWPRLRCSTGHRTHRLDRWAFVGLYVFALGMLLAQYTITGFDASAHVSEETVGARTEAPKAIVRADLRVRDRRPLPEHVDDAGASRTASTTHSAIASGR